MRLREVRIRNFRCFVDEVSVEFGDLTALVGKNDAGKSSILEALAIFFDDKKSKPDGDDAAKHGEPRDMSITCVFDELPDEILIDATRVTTLEGEYLLNAGGYFEVEKVYAGQNKTPSAKTTIAAFHPSASGVQDLLKLKLADLKTRAKELDVDLSGVNQSVSSEVRRAIRTSVGDLALQLVKIEVDTDVGAKELYARIQTLMPTYYLFKSDRPSTDQDSDAQDPLKAAVSLALSGQDEQLRAVEEVVEAQLSRVMALTLEKVRALSPELAASLSPRIQPPKWDAAFKVSVTDDDEIPMNKRGSGARRLLLLGFFQAQAELSSGAGEGDVVFAIEEPETSQHPDQQRALLRALREIAEVRGQQVLVTTHTPTLGRLMPSEALRFIDVKDDGSRRVISADEEVLKAVSDALGVLPDHDVRLFIGVEGPNDIQFLSRISAVLAAVDDQISHLGELEHAGRIVFIPMGGSNADIWKSRLEKLNRPEFHIFDRDYAPPAEPKYAEIIAHVNARPGCSAVHTSRRELENYLHPNAIAQARQGVALADAMGAFDDVPALVAQAVHQASNAGTDWVSLADDVIKKKVSHAKKWLNREAVDAMTVEMLDEVDTNGDIRGWLRRISELASDPT